ncbi:MAG: dephospho-CoA kinase [Clostridia bacterium]|nr:dephospho-CoA kinase [Clostridia bacterium]
MIIGLTGLICSGKSRISGYLSKKGFEIIDADSIVHEQQRPGEECYLEIVSVFGDGILMEDGEIDRNKLGNMVFSDGDMLKKLNEITHKHVLKEIDRRIEGGGTEDKVLDVPLLFQTHLDRRCDVILIVTASEKTRIRRLMKRNSLSREEAVLRVRANDYVFPEGDNIKVIDNSGTLKSLREKLDLLLMELQGQKAHFGE